ncbi:MAG: NAD(P)-dependent oxidoreductase [Bacteroidales bacterium]|nr:NAD(P)-dependent oxidoreductase [Bacteroidales bacterium]
MIKIVFAEPIGLTDDDMNSFTSEMEQQGNSVTFYNDVPKDNDELIQRIADAKVLVVSNLPVSATTINAAKNLRYISVAFTGVDHIAQEACRQRGIAISNAAGYSTQAVAELTIGMAIDLFRKITPADAVTRSLGGRNGFLGRELAGKTFGILGAGAIGQRVAQLANAFGCNVVAWSLTEKYIPNVTFLPFDEVIRTADILSLHLPLTPQTENLIGIRELEMMKPESVLINTARAKVVNTKALVDALYQKIIAGAAIDIYEYEPPLQAEHPLLTATNTLLLPHIGFATHEAIALRSKIVMDNIRRWLEGKPQNVVA